MSQAANMVVVHEVGLRDGLQMERQTVPTETKLRWIERLVAAGVDIIQVGSFVHPTKVPQMADTDELFRRLRSPGSKPEHTIFSALVLNEKGLERGVACDVDMLCMGVSASETHSRKNIGMSVEEATRRIVAMARQARDLQKMVQVSVQSAFGCGYEGRVPRERVLELVRKFLDAGMKNISFADTAGHATPDDVSRMFAEITSIDASAELTCHFHNTYGLALANCYAAMNAGVKYFESSIAGLGGCPFTKIAGGNVCTEDFVHYLHRIGFRSDVKLAALTELAEDVAAFFGRDLPGTVYKVGPVQDEGSRSG